MKGDAASGLACAARWGRSGRGVGAGRVLGAGVAALGRGWAREWAVGKEKGFAGWGGFGVWVFFNLFYFYSKINKV